MNTKHYTSIEQSKKLLELGLSPESADCCWRVLPGVKNYMPNQYIALAIDKIHFETDIPCWSLGALLELMPNSIVSHDTAFEDEDAEGINIIYYKHLEIGEKNVWECSYKDNGILSYFEADTPLEAIFNMVVWLLENGYIKQNN